MRSKEDAQDYRYFPDPDLLPLEIAERWIDQVRSAMPPLPEALRARYEREHQLSPYTASLVTEAREKADYFERALAAGVDARLAANWITGELAAIVNERGADFAACPVAVEAFAKLLARIQDGTLSGKAAKDVLHAMADGGGDPDAIIERKGLKQISDSGAIEAAVDAVLAAQPRLVEDYRAGKEKAFNALVGQVMKATQGKANPQEVTRILRERLAR